MLCHSGLSIEEAMALQDGGGQPYLEGTPGAYAAGAAATRGFLLARPDPFTRLFQPWAGAPLLPGQHHPQ